MRWLQQHQVAAIIKGGTLSALTATASTSSGADIIINVSKELTAIAQSGGDVRYLGNSERKNQSRTSEQAHQL